MRKRSFSWGKQARVLLCLCLLPLFLLPETANAAVTIAQYGTTTNDSSDGTSYNGPTGTPGANHTLVVFVDAAATVAAATMTGGGLTWTRKASQNYSTTSTLYMFWANTGASPGATNIVFDCTGDSATGANITAFEITNSDVVTADPIKQVKTSSSSSSNPATTMDTAFTATNGGVYAAAMPRNPPGITPPAGWTEVNDSGHSSPTFGMETAWTVGETGTAITTTGGAAVANGMIVAEIYETGTGPAPPASSVHGLGLLGVGP